MFQHLYTTAMSGNAKKLQKRFVKIRSKRGRLSKLLAVVTTVVILAATTCATFVLAAAGGDGLENLTQREVYFVTGMRASVPVDLNRMPDWVKELSSDGSLTVQTDLLNVREPFCRSFMNGNVDVEMAVKISGDRGSVQIGNGLCATTVERTYAFCTFSDETRAFILWMPVDENGNITARYVCFTTPDSEDVAYQHTAERKENFIPVSDETVQYFGDFNGTLKRMDYFTMSDYFTAYEENYRNRVVDGIDLQVVSLDRQALTLKVDVDREEANAIAVCVRPKEMALCATPFFPLALDEVNHSTFHIEKAEFNCSYYFYKENPAPGKEYVVDLILVNTGNLDTVRNLDAFRRHGYLDDHTVLYRQREIVTMS